MTPTETLGAGDRAVAILGVILLLTGVLVWYFVARLIFDHSLAILSAGLILVTDLMWQFALAGLPQHLLIILFGIVTYCALKASRANEEENDLQVFLWLGGAGLGLGLMSLTNGVTAFFVPGFLVFRLVGFDARIRAFLVPLFAYFLCVTPWLIRNTMVCGNPLGLSVYTALAGAGVTESSIMRGVSTGLIFGGGMATKFRSGIMDQAAHLWEYFGLNLAVIAFVVSVLHPFRSSFASLWRWIILLMWVGAIIGMTLFGVSGAVSGNQLHAVFLPTFIIYGLAFVLVLWNRLEISFKPLRIAFLTLIFFISGTPMLLTLLAGQTARIQWPPYVPPFIAILQNWFQKDEILCSDMPWAVAWYADRKCLLLPETVKAFDEISDYSTLGSAIVGLYLTPISGRDDFLSLVKGTNKEWGPVIMRTVNLNEFLLKSFTPLPIDGECILYADTERWARKTIK
jgi:4-amino-4-deoxy-L-arabinose transferase-like glycosyltransferase